VSAPDPKHGRASPEDLAAALRLACEAGVRGALRRVLAHVEEELVLPGRAHPGRLQTLGELRAWLSTLLAVAWFALVGCSPAVTTGGAGGGEIEPATAAPGGDGGATPTSTTDEPTTTAPSSSTAEACTTDDDCAAPAYCCGGTCVVTNCPFAGPQW
jgi:hypothetical protein